MSPAERRLFHAQVADILEFLYSDRLDTIAIQLARHYSESGNREKSSFYLEKASDHAWHLGEIEQARNFFSKALIALETLDEKSIQKAYLLWRIGRTYFVTGYYELAEEQYRASTTFAQEAKNDDTLACSLISLASCLRRKQKIDEALKTIVNALEFLQETTNLSLKSRALRGLGIAYSVSHSDKVEL